MVAPTVPTMVWGGQIRLMARALGVELDEIRETLERRPLDDDRRATATMGDVRGRHPGRAALRGAGHRRRRAADRHRARHPHPPVLRTDWPTPPDGDGAHRVIIEGRPRIEVTVEATDEGGNRAAGGNATAVGRLVSAIDWLVAAEPGLYDALDVPLRPASRQTRKEGPAHEHRHSRRQGPDRVRVGRDGPRHRHRRRRTSPWRCTTHTTLGPARVRGRPAADRADQRVPVLPGLAHRTGRREGRGGVRRRGRPTGAPPTPSTTAPGWPPSTPSGTPSTTTAWTTSSGRG